MTNCAAKRKGIVREKGKASVEFYIGDKPQYYCEGYIDMMTDEFLPECKNCRNHVSYAQEDLERSK